MAVAFVGEPELGAALWDLFRAVVDVAEKTAKFKSLLKRLTQTLRDIDPIFRDIQRLKSILYRPEEETQSFIHYLNECRRLVLECSTIQWWNLNQKLDYSSKLMKLDAELVKFFQINVQPIELGVNDLTYEFDRVLSAVTTCSGDSSGSSHSRLGSIFSSSNDLLLRLRASLDALDEMPLVKECYLDLGSFPEAEKIAATALSDMWVESYNLDEEGFGALDNLIALKSRSLIDLIAPREDAKELEGYCNEYFVMQHGSLRELTICLSSQEPVVQRKRLFLEINKNDFPEWWAKQSQQPTETLLLSISTDDTFSSSWYDLRLPALEILILNLRTRKYALPHFMETLNKLKVLIIMNYGICTSELVNIPLIGLLSNLRRIRFQRVLIFSLDRNFLQLKNLRKISFIMCDLGRAFESCATEIPYILPNVAELEIDRCDDFKELPSQLCNIVSLEKLSITYCHELCRLPDELRRLTNLKVLILNSCTKLEKLPASIRYLHKLSFLDIADCLSITELPMVMGALSGLEVLRMSGCRGLRELSTSVSSLSKLEEVICDEETSYLWRGYEHDLVNLKLRVAKEDIFGSFMKVFPPSIFSQ